MATSTVFTDNRSQAVRLPTDMRAELVHGAEKNQFPTKNLSTIEDVCSRLHVLPYTDAAAYHLGARV
jgi:predicted nucleic acid-binding protein